MCEIEKRRVEKCDGRDCEHVFTAGEIIYKQECEALGMDEMTFDGPFDVDCFFEASYHCAQCYRKSVDDNMELEDELMTVLNCNLESVMCESCGRYIGDVGHEKEVVATICFERGYPDTYWEPGQPSYLYVNCADCSKIENPQTDKMLAKLTAINKTAEDIIKVIEERGKDGTRL